MPWRGVSVGPTQPQSAPGLLCKARAGCEQTPWAQTPVPVVAVKLRSSALGLGLAVLRGTDSVQGPGVLPPGFPGSVSRGARSAQGGVRPPGLASGRAHWEGMRGVEGKRQRLPSRSLHWSREDSQVKQNENAGAQRNAMSTSKSSWDQGGFEEEAALELYFKRMRSLRIREGVGPPDRKNRRCQSMEAHGAGEPQVTPSSGQKHQRV